MRVTFSFMRAEEMPSLNMQVFNTLLKKSESALNYLRDLPASLAMLKELTFDYTPLIPYAKHFQSFDDVLILGTGGSSLGAQTLTALRDTETPRLHFMDNIDAHTFNRVIQKINPATTGVIAISKSGNTAETLIQLLTCLQIWQDHKMSDHFLIVSEDRPNAIREIGKQYAIKCLDHPTDIGGRFSVFTVVGLLPALIAGIDVEAFRTGALEIVEALDDADVRTCPTLIGALLQASLMQQNVNQHVMFTYCDRLSLLASWWCQLWGESIGKKNTDGQSVGSTPIRAIGAVDQHSQVQLYIDGPRDKFFTFITLDQQHESPKLSFDGLTHPSSRVLLGKTMGDLMLAEQQATIDVMREKGCPLRQLRIQKLDAANLGALMMHFMLETIAAAFLLNINAFDQPAVEDGKKLALVYLEK